MIVKVVNEAPDARRRHFALRHNILHRTCSTGSLPCLAQFNKPDVRVSAQNERNSRDRQKTSRRAMAENVPPSGTAAKPAASGDRPGLPYYEKLRRDLRDTLQKKRLLDRNMVGPPAQFRQGVLT